MLVSTAHEVFLALPLESKEYVCMRCSVRGSLTRLFSDSPLERCIPHGEADDSGWLGEPFVRTPVDSLPLGALEQRRLIP